MHKVAKTALQTALGLSGSAAALLPGQALGQAGAQTQAPVENRSLESVVVTEQRLNVGLLPDKILNTPQSVTVVSAEVIREQGVNNLQDALKNVPGITLNAGEGGIHGDLVNLRGFSANNDYFLDGLRDTGLNNRDTFNNENLEVLKGPASTLFGRGTTGGAINQVSKMPGLFPVMDFTLTGGNNADIRATGDVNYVLDDTSAVRVNIMGQRNNVVGRPFTRTQKWGIAPSIAFGLGTDTLATLSYLHEQEDSIPDPGVPFLFGAPAPVTHKAFYGLPGNDRFKTDVEVVTGKVTHKIDDVFTVSQTLRYGSYWFDSRQTNPTYGNANCFTSTASPYYYAGGPLCAALTGTKTPTTAFNPLFPIVGTPLSAVYVERDRPSSKGTIATMMSSTQLTANFDTGDFRHHVIMGLEADKEDATLKRFVNQNAVLTATPLLAPDPGQAYPGTQTVIRQTPVTKTATLSGFFADSIDWENWTLAGAVRVDNFGARFTQPLPPATSFVHKDTVASPRASLVYKPNENSAIYFAYGTSFNPSAETLSLAASSQALPPEKDQSFEIGGKINVLDGMLALTAAAFNTVKTNARITDPLTPSLQTLAGTERINGIELGAQGRLTENWELTAGYTYLAPRAVGLVAAGVAGPVPNVAHDQANIWSVYDWDFGLKTGLGVFYTGRRDTNADTLSKPGSTILASAPPYVTVDAMLSYPVNDNFSLQLNVYNLAKNFYHANTYYTRPGENHAIAGAGRTFMLTAGLSL